MSDYRAREAGGVKLYTSTTMLWPCDAGFAGERVVFVLALPLLREHGGKLFRNDTV